MGWPQWTVLALMAFSIVSRFVKGARDPRLSSAQVTVAEFLYVAFTCGYATILHAGGFW